jgi:cobalt/nickel transport system ATP-binding protein
LAGGSGIRGGERAGVLGGVLGSWAMIFEGRAVTYRYAEATALEGVSFRIERRQRVAVLGANGSGKSTLLRLLNGLCFAESGGVYFEGRELTEEGLYDEAFAQKFRQQVAFVFQNPDV